MSFSVSGIASGLDTAALVEGLMFAERAGLRRLEASQADEAATRDAWADIEAKLESLSAAVASVRTGDGLRATVAESSDERVARVTSQPGALPGSYSFRVDSLAAARQVTSEGLASGDELVGAGGASVSSGFAGIGTEIRSHDLTAGTYGLTVVSIADGGREATVVFDGVEQTVRLTGNGRFTVTAADGGTLELQELGGEDLREGRASITIVEADDTTTVNQLAAALNAPGGAVRAQVIDTGDGTATSFRLVITSRQTGVDQAPDIDLGDLALFSGGLTTLREAADATVSLGDGGLTITRPTNTIGDLFDGLVMDLVGVSDGEDVEVVVSPDVDSRVESVAAVVDGVTEVLAQLSTYASYDVEAEEGGPLVGSFTARSVSSEISRALASVVSSGSFVLLSQIGISIQRDGTYSLDEATLRDALTTDPDGVRQVLVGDDAVDDDGVLDVVSTTLGSLLGAGGRVPTAIVAAEENIDALDALIENQEVRLASVAERYQRQFAALESLISQLQSQSTYLAGVLSQTGGAP